MARKIPRGGAGQEANHRGVRTDATAIEHTRLTDEQSARAGALILALEHPSIWGFATTPNSND